MRKAQRRGRAAPLRWGGLVATVGLCVAAAGVYLEFGDRAGATPPANAERTGPARTPSATVKPRSTDGTTKSPVGNGTTKKLVIRPGRPQRISLPQLGVSAPVVSISASRGSLTPPSDPQTVGWWAGGAQPGAKRGSAVITGHTVHAGGGAFDDLGQLQKGDQVVVATARGSLRYRVAGITTYRKQALATHAEQVFDQSVPGRLVLITCEDWNGKVYLSNVVVIAVPTA
jgi:LPXTG-site transpeptidase (sortase) family protein